MRTEARGSPGKGHGRSGAWGRYLSLMMSRAVACLAFHHQAAPRFHQRHQHLDAWHLIIDQDL